MYATDFKKTSGIATANRVYRADFQRAAILRQLPDEFTIHDLWCVMEKVGWKNSQSPDSAPREVTRTMANNYARDCKLKGLIKFIGPTGHRIVGKWRKL